MKAFEIDFYLITKQEQLNAAGAKEIRVSSGLWVADDLT